MRSRVGKFNRLIDFGNDVRLDCPTRDLIEHAQRTQTALESREGVMCDGLLDFFA